MRASLCCIFFAAITVSLAQDGPRLEILPAGEEIRRDLGVTGFFTCKASTENELIRDVVWIDPRGQEVPDERRNRVYSAATSSGEGRELYVTDITEDDTGEYTCKARYGNQEITQKFTLLVYMSIRWEDAPKEQHPVTGTRATIKCVVKANPPAIVEWLDSNGEFIRKTDRYTPLEEGLLHIEDVSSEDDREFVCRAKVPTEGEMSERRIKVEVYSRPDISDPDPGTQVEIVESQEGSIRCQATGKPEPRRTWFGPDGTDASLMPGLTVDGDGTLTFRPASREMAGEYRCSAENQVDMANTTVNVVVIVKPEIVRYANVTSVESESATLECRVTGFPLPTVSFLRDGDDVLPGDGRVRVEQREEDGQQVGKLSIIDLKRADAGTYDCIASNRGGQASAAGLLSVQFQPVVTGPEPAEVFTWNNHSAELRCRAEAEPAAEVSWSFEGRGVEAEGDPQMEETRDGDTAVLTVTPTDPSFYGVYRCTASNSRGSDFVDITLREATAPGLVSGVTTQDVTATSITFAIPPPESDGGVPVSAYLVQYVQQGQLWDASDDGEWPATGPFLLERLIPEQTYLFRFAAANAVGVGGWSEEIEKMMPRIGKPQPPVLISAEGAPLTDGTNPELVITSDEPHSYEAHWRAGADNGADIDSYQVVSYKVISNKNKWHTVTTKKYAEVEMPDPLTFLLKNLKADAYYKLEVRAHNALGYSDPSQVIVHTAKGAAEEAAPHQEQRASSLVIGVVIAVLLALLVLCDLTCYAVNNRGITHMLCSRVRGTSDSAKLTEEAASEKEPLQENGNGNKSSPPPPEVNGERDAGDLNEELNIDKAQLDAAKDSAV